MVSKNYFLTNIFSGRLIDVLICSCNNETLKIYIFQTDNNIFQNHLDLLSTAIDVVMIRSIYRNCMSARLQEY